MTRKLAIWLSWRNFSEYYSRKLADTLRPEYETTITYKPLDWDEFDVVLPFFPGPNRAPGCDPAKVVKFVWEPHEYGWAQDAGTVCAASTGVYERIAKRYGDRAHLLPWGVDAQNFHPQPWPKSERRQVGWAGQFKNPRKQFLQLTEELSTIWDIDFIPNISQMESGRQSGAYELETMHLYYRRLHVYVCASSSEGFCFPLLEACACGRPVVTFDVGVARDLARTGAGIVIVDDWDTLKKAVREVDWLALGAASADAVRQCWLWPRLRERWLEVLDGAG